MDSARKKELRDAYKSREVVGGICCIICSGNQNKHIQATTDIEGLKNRFDFAVLTGTSPDPKMRSEWMDYGSESFEFTVLEELKKKEEQTEKEFSDDVDMLYEMWLEKLAQEGVDEDGKDNNKPVPE